MKNIMVDLETLGTSARAPIVSIGAVVFDDETGELGNEFYVAIDIESALEHGDPVDPATLKWWMRQSDEARMAVISGTATPWDAMNSFFQYVKAEDPTGEIQVWGNGAAFDNVILAELFREYWGCVPWKFWNDRCYRTLKNLRPDIPFTRVGTHHNVLDDAKSQALHAVQLLKAIKQ